MACLLAKAHRPQVDVRKPYTEIGGDDSYSGRSYDERYITPFIMQHDLPCNNTTAFLTPALRNRDVTLTPDLDLVGRPPQLYQAVLELLDDVHRGRVEADDLLAETVRHLLTLRNERQQRIHSLLAELKSAAGATPLAAEDIITLIHQHMSLKGTSRLPVLIVAAAYRVAEQRLGERAIGLHSHNAADESVTSYEMTDKPVTIEDLDHALQKILGVQAKIQNYLFITTFPIARQVQDYAHSLYAETGGIEFAILDCEGFLRHFLHLFYRLRAEFLEQYQALMLAEPASAVSQPVKEAFLAMRQAAEAGANAV